MSYELNHSTTRRTPKLTTPALAKAYGKLPKEDERPTWRKTCSTCGAYYAPYCYGIELMDGSERELEVPYTTESDSWCSYWQREPKTEWNGRPCGRRRVQ